MFQSLKSFTFDIAKLSTVISANNMRNECYFLLTRENDILCAERAVRNVFHAIEYTKCKTKYISKYITLNCSKFLRLICEANESTNASFAAMSLLVYERLVSSIFSLDKVNNCFFVDNYGIGIKSKFFDDKTMCVVTEFWSKNCASKVWRVFDSIFG